MSVGINSFFHAVLSETFFYLEYNEIPIISDFLVQHNDNEIQTHAMSLSLLNLARIRLFFSYLCFGNHVLDA
jgi:hypothetical protein